MVDPAESLDDAVIREVKEETGITAKVLGIIGVKECKKFKFGLNDIFFVFLMEYVSGELTPQTEEGITSAKWMTKDDLKDLDGKVGITATMCKNAFTTPPEDIKVITD